MHPNLAIALGAPIQTRKLLLGLLRTDRVAALPDLVDALLGNQTHDFKVQNTDEWRRVYHTLRTTMVFLRDAGLVKEWNKRTSRGWALTGKTAT